MDLIDEEGNLFGLINIIDALVVLMVVAIVAAGSAMLVTKDNEPEPDVTRYVTVELSDQPIYVAEQISEGDVMGAASGGHNLTVINVYSAPSDGDSVSMTVLAKVDGAEPETERETEDSDLVRFSDKVLRPGVNIEIRTQKYRVNGTVTNVDRDRTELDVTQTEVTLQSTVDTSISDQLETGQTFEVAGRQIAEFNDVRAYPTGNPSQRRVQVDVSLRSLRGNDRLRFGETPVRIGSTVSLESENVAFSGTIVELGKRTRSNEQRSREVALKLANVEPEFADGIEVGADERIRGTTSARVTDKRVEPAVVILTSDDGDIYQREHPRNKDVYLTVELVGHNTRDGFRFHGKIVQQGDEILLDLGTVTVRGTVVEMDSP